MNLADNYIQPTYKDLRPDNIVIIGGFCIVVGARENDIDIHPPQSLIIQTHSYKYITGVDLKKWIYNIDVLHVIDALLLGNGFVKGTPPFNVKYSREGIIIQSGYEFGWLMIYGDKRKELSYLHEIQNTYEDWTGSKLSVGERVF